MAEHHDKTCTLCFKCIESIHTWTTCSPELIKSVILTDNPPYAPIVLSAIQPMLLHNQKNANGLDKIEAVLCDYCNIFIKERTLTHYKKKRVQRKHGMHIAILHLLSGGTVCTPSQAHMRRCILIMQQPGGHPFLHLIHNGVVLKDRIAARKRIQNQYDCVVRWLFEGRPRVFSDPVFAKHMRRWMSKQHHYHYHHDDHHRHHDLKQQKKQYQSRYKKHNNKNNTSKVFRPISKLLFSSSSTQNIGSSFQSHIPLWKLPLPNACRFCCNKEQSIQSMSNEFTTIINTTNTSTTGLASNMEAYSTALMYGKSTTQTYSPSSCANDNVGFALLEKKIMQIENQATADRTWQIPSGTLFLCIKCHRMSVISFEYDCAIRKWLGLDSTVMCSADAYYTHVLQMFEHHCSDLHEDYGHQFK